MGMDPQYNPADFEARILEQTEDLYRPLAPAPKNQKSFMITMPPPNVTGILHMGHALFVSLQDLYIRWKRMNGYNALWLPGTDHAGIATQVMVERQVESEGSSRLKLGREAFLKRVWDWKEEYGDTIMEQIRALGSSCDWTRSLFTLDKKSSLAVRESFVRLFHEGLIYRGERIVNWSSGLQTAISDLEVESKPVQGALYTIKYRAADGSGEFLSVATTRPETIFADVAVAVHPDDPRFKNFHGKEVIVPLVDRHVPVILDEYVDREFGTGALKITPGHDPNDWQIGQRHGLLTISCIGKDGKLNQLAGPFAGATAAHSKKKVAEKLQLEELLIKEEKYYIELGYCQRSGVVVEPLVSMQWFVRAKTLAAPAIKAAEGEDPALRFYPDYWKKTWFEWLNNIQDWCISRQLWWGHQIPAWHCGDCGRITVPKNGSAPDPNACDHCGSKEITQDPDVLDTWYSSALWPISTLGWPEKTPDLDTFYPHLRCTDPRAGQEAKALMETGSDILFFWVARMVMMCSHFMNGRLPFEDVFLHAMVRDEKGQKMSKTKGNVIDPLEVTEKHGSDALRVTLIALSGQGKNVNLDLKRLEGYKSFINKIWNASRFSLTQISEAGITKLPRPDQNPEKLDLIDRFILENLRQTCASVQSNLLSYRPDGAFHDIYQFTWYEFCDWYLELLKIRKGSRDTLAFTLDQILRLLHPMAPLVTERIFEELPWRGNDRLALGSFPQLQDLPPFLSDSDRTKIEGLKAVVEGLRNFRTENKISPKIQLTAYLQTSHPNLWKELSPFVEGLAKVSVRLENFSSAGLTGRVVTPEFSLTLPLEGVVDREAEKTRLQHELKKVKADLEFSEKRLGNEAFIARAKPELVVEERKKAAEAKDKLSALELALRALG
jgi:valyl-tRNA synthetase